MTLKKPSSPSSLRPRRRFNPGSAPIVKTRWQDMSLDAELFYYVLAVNCDHTAMTFSLNLTNPTRCLLDKTVMDDKEYFAQRLRDHLPGIPLFFILEASPRDRLHIHGLLNPLGQDDQYIEARLKKVAGDKRKLKTLVEKSFRGRRAVVYTAPDWTKSHHHRPDRFGPYGWACYIAKDIAKTQKLIGTNKSLLSVRQNVIDLAKKYHQEDCDAARSYKAA